VSENLWLICDCYHHAIAVSDEFVEEGEGEIYLSFWRYGNYEGGWRERLRHIWHILKYGHPYTDEIVLRAEQALKLTERLTGVFGQTGSGEEGEDAVSAGDSE